MHPFSIADEPWIPVLVRRDLDQQELKELAGLLPAVPSGGRLLVSLHDLLRAAHLLADLDVAFPPVESMLRRLLVAVVARVTRLDTGPGEKWLDHRDEVLAAGRIDPDEVGAYLDMHRAGLDLYDPVRPFLQDPRLADECGEPTVPGRLVMNRASGANAVWADHTAQTVPVTAADAVGWVLAWRGYGPSGMGAVRAHGGRTSKSCKAGPLRALLSYVPHLPGRLFQSLVVAIPGPASWPANPGEDLAPWETDVLPDPLAPAAPSGVVSLLTARSAHAVLLTADDTGRTVGCRVAWGTAADLPTVLDPYVIDREAGGPVRASRDRAVWRDLDALLLKERPGSKVVLRRPTVFDTMHELPPEMTVGLGVRAIGWDQDRQDKNTQWFTASTPPVLSHVEESDADGAAAIAQCRSQAETVAGDLGRALAGAWHAVNTGRRDDERQALIRPAVAAFWERGERDFWRVVRDTTQRPAFRRLALAVYDEATVSMGASARGMAAVAKARAVLANPPRKGTRKAG